MADSERLLVAEDDPPLRLVALALGAPLDEKMRVAVSRFFTEAPETMVARLRGLAEARGLLDAVVPELASDGDLGAQLEGVHYLLIEGAQLPAEAIAQGTALRLIQKHGEDCRNIDLAAAERHGIPVRPLRRRGNSDVAEHTLLLMLAVARRLLTAHAVSAAGREDSAREASSYNWARLEGVTSLRGLALGLVGLGEIGRDLARKVQPFGMRTLYTQRRRLDAALEQELQVEYRALDDMLAESDVVSLHLPMTSETQGLISAERLRRMRRGAILINTSRGSLVDETALATALEDGHLAGAGLDVRVQEPPHPASPLARLPNVVLSPHIGAGTSAALFADVAEVLDNIVAVKRGA